MECGPNWIGICMKGPEMAFVAVIKMVLGDMTRDIVERGRLRVFVGMTMGSMKVVDLRLEIEK